MDMDERWANRSPEVMLETFHWYRGEGFEHIVDDLQSNRTPVVVEGFRLLPRLVAPLLGNRDRAVWLLPTEAFRQHAFESRGSMWDIANNTSDPPRALSNLLDRDRRFTDRLANEVESLHLKGIRVDLGMAEDELATEVAWLLSGDGRDLRA
jgi:hypothetical protein